MIELLLAAALLGPADLAADAAAHFERHEYAAGIEKLQQAYALDPDPAFLFAQAAGYQQLEDYERAIVLYERFLGSGPHPDQAQKAYERIQECRAAAEKEEPPPPTAVANPVRPQEPAEPEQTARDDAPRDKDARPRRRATWPRDVPGGVLLGVGLASGIAGGTMIGVGAARRMSADTESTEGAFRDQLRSSNTLQGVGIGLAVTGGALILGAVIRYALVARRSVPASVALRF